MSEEWRPVVGYEGLYDVSNAGRVRRVGGGYLRPMAMPRGYLQVALSSGGVERRHLVHRLVASAWLGPPPPGTAVNHIDGDKANNRADNLEWATARQNTAHAIETGLYAPTGETNPAAKLREADVREILRLRGTATHKEIAARFRVHRSTVSQIYRGHNWPHIADGRRR